MPTINLTDAELAALTATIRRLIDEDKFPRAPRSTRCARRSPSSSAAAAALGADGQNAHNPKTPPTRLLRPSERQARWQTVFRQDVINRPRAGVRQGH